MGRDFGGSRGGGGSIAHPESLTSSKTENRNPGGEPVWPKYTDFCFVLCKTRMASFRPFLGVKEPLGWVKEPFGWVKEPFGWVKEPFGWVKELFLGGLRSLSGGLRSG